MTKIYVSKEKGRPCWTYSSAASGPTVILDLPRGAEALVWHASSVDRVRGCQRFAVPLLNPAEFSVKDEDMPEGAIKLVTDDGGYGVGYFMIGLAADLDRYDPSANNAAAGGAEVFSDKHHVLVNLWSEELPLSDLRQILAMVVDQMGGEITRHKENGLLYWGEKGTRRSRFGSL